MRTQQLIVLLLLAVFTVSQTGCNKKSDQELAEKKAKELRKGEFHNPPAKSY